jgi:trimeric autotransporter adhesin
MQRTFFIIAVSALGITTAHGQTVLQLNGQTSGSESAVASETLGIPPPPSTSSSSPAIGSVGSDPLGVPTSSLGSASSPSSGSSSGTSSGATTTGLASGGPGAMNAAATTSPQSPLLLRGEIPDTSTQAASATASAPASASPICAPPVPSTDGGSANLTEIAGVSLNGC